MRHRNSRQAHEPLARPRRALPMPRARGLLAALVFAGVLVFATTSGFLWQETHRARPAGSADGAGGRGLSARVSGGPEPAGTEAPHAARAEGTEAPPRAAHEKEKEAPRKRGFLNTGKGHRDQKQVSSWHEHESEEAVGEHEREHGHLKGEDARQEGEPRWKRGAQVHGGRADTGHAEKGAVGWVDMVQRVGSDDTKAPRAVARVKRGPNGTSTHSELRYQKARRTAPQSRRARDTSGVTLGAVVADGPGAKAPLAAHVGTLLDGPVRAENVLVVTAQLLDGGGLGGVCRGRGAAAAADGKVHCSDWFDILGEPRAGPPPDPLLAGGLGRAHAAATPVPYRKSYLNAFEAGVKWLDRLVKAAGRDPPTHYLYLAGFLSPTPLFAPQLVEAAAAAPGAVLGCSWVAPTGPPAQGTTAPTWRVHNHGFTVDKDYRGEAVLNAVYAGASPWDRRVGGVRAAGLRLEERHGTAVPLYPNGWEAAVAAQAGAREDREVDVVAPTCAVVPRKGLELVGFWDVGTAGRDEALRGLSLHQGALCRTWELARELYALTFAGQMVLDHHGVDVYMKKQKMAQWKESDAAAQQLVKKVLAARAAAPQNYQACPDSTPAVAEAEAYQRQSLAVGVGAQAPSALLLFQKVLPIVVDGADALRASLEAARAVDWGTRARLAPLESEDGMAFLLDVAGALERHTEEKSQTGLRTASGAHVLCCAFDGSPEGYEGWVGTGEDGAAVSESGDGSGKNEGNADDNALPLPQPLHPYLPMASYSHTVFTSRLTEAYRGRFAGRDARAASGIALFYQGYCCRCCGFSNEWLRYLVALERRVQIYSNTGAHCHCAGVPVGELNAVDRMYIRKGFLLPAMPRDQLVVTVAHTPPDGYDAELFKTRQFIGRRPDYFIGRSMYEFDTVPSDWVDFANAGDVDEIWVPTEFGRLSLLDSGVDGGKVRIIPEAIDTDFFDPGVAEPIRVLPSRWRQWSNAPKTTDLSGRYVFLSVFKWEPRKGPEVLLEEYMKTFENAPVQNDRPPTLVVLTWRWAADYDPKATWAENEAHRRNVTYFQTLVTQMAARAKVAAPPHVVVITEALTEQELLGLYAGADAFVLPTRGEGWGLPIIQAMAMRLPTVTTDWAGATQFITEENSYPVRVSAVANLTDEAVAAYNVHGARWAEVDREHFARLMAHVYNNPEEAKQRGAVARVDVVQNFGQEAVADLIMARLEAIRRSWVPPEK